MLNITIGSVAFHTQSSPGKVICIIAMIITEMMKGSVERQLTT
ncbi:MAG: hypothetical protein ACNA8L_13355 [Luteolibacter sp.]